jgi:hypothetical protein
VVLSRAVVALSLVTLAGAVPTIAQAQQARLTRTDDPDSPLMRGEAKVGEIVVSYYDRMQRKHRDAFPHMDDAFVCRSGSALIVRDIAKTQARQRDAAAKALIRQGDESALQSLAVDVVGQLDGVANASIRADEAIGPGIYHPSILAIAYTIGRCRFF